MAQEGLDGPRLSEVELEAPRAVHGYCTVKVGRAYGTEAEGVLPGVRIWKQCRYTICSYIPFVRLAFLNKEER